jgi:hypothetical protein
MDRFDPEQAETPVTDDTKTIALFGGKPSKKLTGFGS